MARDFTNLVQSMGRPPRSTTMMVPFGPLRDRLTQLGLGADVNLSNGPGLWKTTETDESGQFGVFGELTYSPMDRCEGAAVTARSKNYRTF